MTDHDFTTTISVDQAPDEAYSAILHVADWWTGSNEGKRDEVGDEFIHRDGETHYCKIRVTELVPGRRVGCGSTGVSWLRCEDEVIAVFDVVDALVLLA
jgi:hypothetical protein